MKDFLSKITAFAAGAWAKWTVTQKLILAGIGVGVIAALVALVGVSRTPSMAPVIDAAIADDAARTAIITRINQEGVKTSVQGGIVMVKDDATAEKMRAIIIREGLVPSGTSPWAIFDMERWTLTDFERNVNLQRAIQEKIRNHIKALDEVDNAEVALVVPARTLFPADQNPVTASIIITPRPGSDITANRQKIEGIQKIAIFAVEGLTADNITIVDNHGIILNDFEGMRDFDRLSLIEKGEKLRRSQEMLYRASVLAQLQSTFGADRVRDLAISIAMDMSKKETEKTEVTPIILKAQTPGLAYDDSQRVESVTISETTSSTSWKGTGFNPEGPPGVEGQTPPVLKDMSNLTGEVTQETRTHNEEINKSVTKEEYVPTIDRRTVSVNIDGVWQHTYDEKGRLQFEKNGAPVREYSPLTPEQIRDATSLIQGAIGYSAARGDSVTVTNIAFDRSSQFAEENAALAKSRQTRFAIIMALGGLVVFCVVFVLVKAFIAARERARQRREMEAARQAQLAREAEILEAEREGTEAEISAEDAAYLEIVNKAIALAREKPADAGQLIRTWLMEE